MVLGSYQNWVEYGTSIRSMGVPALGPALGPPFHKHLSPRKQIIPSFMSLNLDPNTTLRPRSSSVSPVRSNTSPKPSPNTSPTFSPIRRSGSPLRRQQIHDIERQNARLNHPSPQPPAKKHKAVSFNSDIEYLEPKKSTKYSPDVNPDSIHQLQRDVADIKTVQGEILHKLNYILDKLDK